MEEKPLREIGDTETKFRKVFKKIKILQMIYNVS